MFGFRKRPIRLPQDVLADGDRRGTPDLSKLTGPVDRYAAAYATAATFDDRARALWGLIARGNDALPWIDRALRSEDPDVVADAAGVLVTIGIPPSWRARVARLVEQDEASESADILSQALEADEPDEAAAREGLLFGGRYDAFTKNISYIRFPLDELARAYAEWDVGPKQLAEPEASQALTGDLETLLGHLEPHYGSAYRTLLVEAQNGWTAVIDNAGTSDVTYMTRVLGVESLQTRFSPAVRRNGQIANYGVATFNYKGSGGTERYVEAIQDGRWKWFTEGSPLAFEDVSLHGAKKISDRLTIDTLNRYCDALGIRRDDPAFYGPRAVLRSFDIEARWGRRIKTMSSAQWLKERY